MFDQTSNWYGFSKNIYSSSVFIKKATDLKKTYECSKGNISANIFHLNLKINFIVNIFLWNVFNGFFLCKSFILWFKNTVFGVSY